MERKEFEIYNIKRYFNLFLSENLNQTSHFVLNKL